MVGWHYFESVEFPGRGIRLYLVRYFGSSRTMHHCKTHRRANRTTEAAIATTRRKIELLHEHRERLIADVITGKVDVREVAAQLPEELELPEDEILETADEGDGALNVENVDPVNEEAAPDEET